MQKTTAVINSFSSGEVSPKLNARTDLAQYQNSCRTVQNGIVCPQGGVEKRPGTYFVGEVKDSTVKARLIPFKYSATQQYVLEFGNHYIRFYWDHAQVISSPGVPLEVVTPYATADLPDLSFVQSADVMYFAHQNYPPAKLSRTSTGWAYSVISFQSGQLPVSNAGAGQIGCVRLTVNNHGLSSNSTVFISGVLGVPQADGIWVINVIDVNTFDLIGSVLPGYPITSVTRSATTGYLGLITVAATGFNPFPNNAIVNIGEVQGTVEANGTWGVTYFGDTGPYLLANSAFVNTYISGGWLSLASSYNYISGGGVTLVQAVTALADNGAGLVRVTSANHGFTSGQGVRITLGPNPPAGTPLPPGPWEITVIDDNTYDLKGSVYLPSYVATGYGVPVTFLTSNNFPSSVMFFEQRLVWGGTINQPQTLWLSVTGDFENLVRGTNADDALEYSLNSDGMNAIQWMASWNVLLLGTVDGEWRFGGASITDPITPTSALAKIQSNKGSAKIKAILVGDFVIFVQYYGRKVYQIGYAFVSDSFTSSELTKLAAHMTLTGFVDMTSQESPETIVWFVRTDGVLVSMTFYTDEKIVAFARHTTQGSYESITRINGATEDELWVIVDRKINGQTKRFIEYFMPRDFTAGWPMEDITVPDGKGGTKQITEPVRPYPYFFVDSGLTFDGGAQTVNALQGLDHLNGMLVDICADGHALPSQVVTAGGLTLPDYFNYVSVGLHYDYILEPQSLEMNIQTGTSVGVIKRIEKVTLRLYNTVGGQVGPDQSKLQDVLFPIDGHLFSGDLEIEFPGDYDTNAFITVMHSLPLPCTVLGVMPILEAYPR